MNRVLKIEIQNFQSLEHVVVEPGGFTLVKGESDIGKSSLVRAIQALVLNEFPKTYIRLGAAEGRVTIQTLEGTVSISRTRAESSVYRIEWPDGKTEFHTKCGRGAPPPDVQKVLGVHRIEVDEGSYVTPSIQQQLEGMFPLNLPDASVSKLLGKTNNINVVFVALRKVEADERKKATDLAAAQRLLEYKEKQLKEFADLPLQQEALAAVETAETDVDSCAAISRGSAALLVELDAFRSALKKSFLGDSAAQVVEELTVKCRQESARLTVARVFLHDITRLAKETAANSPVAQAQAAVAATADAVDAEVKLLAAAAKLLSEMDSIRHQHNERAKEYRETDRLRIVEHQRFVTALDHEDICPLTKQTWCEGCKEKIVAL